MNSGRVKKCFGPLWVVGGLCIFLGHAVAASDAGSTAPSTNRPMERPVDPMEKWFTNSIAEIKGKLQNPAITNATELKILKSDLTRYERNLSEHQRFQQTDNAAREAFYAESERFRQEMLRQFPTQDIHSLLQSLKEQHERISADMDRNVQLWANYHKAKQTKDPESVAKAERELVDYLTAQIGRIDHKQYPEGMTLSEVMRYYEKHSVKRTIFGRITKRHAVILILAAIFLLPPAVVLFNWRRRAQKVR
jgi:hypothetical protein